jgi:hypothetical protein
MEYRVRTSDDFRRVTATMHSTSLPFTVRIVKGQRTLSQNALIHKWIGEIAEQTGESGNASFTKASRYSWRMIQASWLLSAN